MGDAVYGYGYYKTLKGNLMPPEVVETDRWNTVCQQYLALQLSLMKMKVVVAHWLKGCKLKRSPGVSSHKDADE